MRRILDGLHLLSTRAEKTECRRAQKRSSERLEVALQEGRTTFDVDPWSELFTDCIQNCTNAYIFLFLNRTSFFLQKIYSINTSMPYVKPSVATKQLGIDRRTLTEAVIGFQKKRSRVCDSLAAPSIVAESCSEVPILG